jgi:cytochrome c oxidase subunit 2
LLGLETAHSPNADDITTIHAVMVVVAAVFAVAINAALLLCVMRFRAARGREPRRFRGQGAVQARVGGVLALVALAIFIAGIVYTQKASDVAASPSQPTAQVGLSVPSGTEPLHIRAVGQQWIWRYEYPAPSGGGTNAAATGTQSFADVFSYYELVVPVDTTVIVDVDSTDVMHRWWVPELGGKFDALPGHINRTWFKADREGTYEGQSAAFSGASYAVMRTQVRVVSQPEYQAWLTKQAAGIKAAQATVQQQLATGVPGEPGAAAPQAKQAGKEGGGK